MRRGLEQTTNPHLLQLGATPALHMRRWKYVAMCGLYARLPHGLSYALFNLNSV
jgi:hypothetical protein